MSDIKPELASGFRDYLAGETIPRQKMFETIQATMERFGFVPLDTPALEKEEILTGGDPNFRMNIFRASLRGGEEKLALRFDLTVPLARVVAQYGSQIPKPFKRYQTGKVWRGERPQAGRYREFVQFDADIVGSGSMMADAEIIALIYETMTALNVPSFNIRVNNRKILNGLSDYAGFAPVKNSKVLRSIDKMDKLGWEGVQAELTSSEKDGVGLTYEQASAIKRFIEIRGAGQKETLDAVESLMANSAVAMEGARELREIMACVRALGVSEDSWTIDLSVARGLGYYTGPVFETVLNDLPSIGSVFSGGRYDGLVARFSPIPVPATGASVGVDRLFAALEQLGLVKKQSTVAKVIVLNFDPDATEVCQQVATGLRRADIPTEIYMGAESNLKGQLAFAVKQGLPVVVIIGADEMSRGVAQIKNMDARTQVETPIAGINEKVKAMLE